MTHGKVYCAGMTPASKFARKYLSEAGISCSDSPDWDIRHLLLDIPSFRPGLWSDEGLNTLLSSLPHDVTVWGGNLDHPALEAFRTIDLLKDNIYLQENAGITADCTIPIAESELHSPLHGRSALIIGWGRIGKSLSEKLKQLGSQVTVASRSVSHREEAASRGFHTAQSDLLTDRIQEYQLIINTAPAHVLSIHKKMPSVIIDLASVRGISGDGVLWARALPGKYAPERSGKLIADTFLRLSKEAF